jgi:mRNA-degrading endonuclease toxin of MazEF toxin-antitoxin module
MRVPLPGEVYFAYVEGGKRRRVIVVSRQELNRGSYLIAIPTTTRRLSTRYGLANCVFLAAGREGFPEDTIAQAESITMLEMSDLDLESGPITILDGGEMQELIRAIGYVIDADCQPGSGLGGE